MLRLVDFLLVVRSSSAGAISEESGDSRQTTGLDPSLAGIPRTALRPRISTLGTGKWQLRKPRLERDMARRGMTGWPLWTALAAFAASSGALASIPVQIRLIIVSADPHDQALSRGFATILQEYGAFLNAGSPAYQPDILRCLAERRGREACVRSALKPGEQDREMPPVVVLIDRASANGHEWRCPGAGEDDFAPARQTVSVRMKAALLGSLATRFQERKKAIECILSAASEAQGRVRR